MNRHKNRSRQTAGLVLISGGVAGGLYAWRKYRTAQSVPEEAAAPATLAQAAPAAVAPAPRASVAKPVSPAPPAAPVSPVTAAQPAAKPVAAAKQTPAAPLPIESQDKETSLALSLPTQPTDVEALHQNLGQTPSDAPTTSEHRSSGRPITADTTSLGSAPDELRGQEFPVASHGRNRAARRAARRNHEEPLEQIFEGGIPGTVTGDKQAAGSVGSIMDQVETEPSSSQSSG